MQWLADITAAAGEPVSVTVSAVTHDAHVSVATAAEFIAWCEQLRIPPGTARRDSSHLGPLAEATTTAHGWALHVRLFGAPVEELP
jgi:hypothetical protein